VITTHSTTWAALTLFSKMLKLKKKEIPKTNIKKNIEAKEYFIC